MMRLRLPALPGALLLPFLFQCALKESGFKDAPIITSASYQHTLYNGRSQGVEVKAAAADAPPFVITYYKTEEDLERGINGSAEEPAEVGDYYAKIKRPAGNGYKQGNSVKIEYHIQKAFISIIAEAVQRFNYDGGPKQIEARAEPPAEPPLGVLYFDEGSAVPLPAPPTDRGRYRAAVTFPGNARYMGASREVEIRIE